MDPCLHLYSPALTPTQDKTAKAEEEAALLEEQSRHHKEQLDNALRQIEKLKADSQSVDHIFLRFPNLF
jgi:chromosome segregation ATPase